MTPSLTQLGAYESQCVTHALRFLAEWLPPKVAEIVRGTEIPPLQKDLSKEMRARLPEATRYSAFSVLVRLRDFATVAAKSFEADTKVSLPRPTTDVDYTVAIIWKSLSQKTRAEHARVADWKELGWNPFESLRDTLAKLARYIGKRHFGIDIE